MKLHYMKLKFFGKAFPIETDSKKITLALKPTTNENFDGYFSNFTYPWAPGLIILTKFDDDWTRIISIFLGQLFF